MKTIAIITSGGDAPGMNAAVRAVTREAIYKGLKVYGIHRGYTGLLANEITELNLRSVSGIIDKGGTILKTARCKEIRSPEGVLKASKILKSYGIEGMVAIGGDGSLKAGIKISRHGIKVVNIPASIDNDIYGTDETIGFDTALDTAVSAIDKIRDTATSHDRVFIIEVMGREHGFLALAVGVASGAEFIIIPEVKYNLNKLCSQISGLKDKGKTSVIIVFAEGAGNSHKLAKNISERNKCEVRVSSLGYIQRGGSPSGRSRILASHFGAHAVKLLIKNKLNRLVVLKNGKITDISFSEVLRKEKKINKDFYKLAKELAT